MACAGEAEGRARRGGMVVVDSVYDTPCFINHSVHRVQHMGESLVGWKRQALVDRLQRGRAMLTVRRPRPIVPTNLEIVIVGRDIAI